jgi:indolepyruvate ferredoxin oxidoreductase beta subunit
MTVQDSALSPRARDARVDAILKVAVMAVGGQGGGVLTNWIEATARANGYAVQATSVAGVAQRTGATVYYLEMAPESGATPVFSLMPAAGDVDILIAAEMMEAGRAILRGFVTPDRTTLIASTHRQLAVSEKMAPGNGMANADEVRAAAEVAAQRLILFDMERTAVEAGSVISASLFGALAGSGALPFPRESFEEAIRTSGRGVDASLRAFARAHDNAQGNGADPTVPPTAPEATAPSPEITGPTRLLSEWQGLITRVADLPAPVRDMASRGLRKIVDFQDTAYGQEYLGHLSRVVALDDPANDHELSREAAKYIANAMAYDDVIRVADLKTRAQRLGRISVEMGAGQEQLLQLTEFLHPRAEEIVGLFPAGLGARVQGSERAMRLIDRLVNRGRRMRTDRLRGFVPLYILAGLRRWRRGMLRHRIEQQHLADWLQTALQEAPRDYALAVEILRTRRLIKGYSDTHARGLSKYDRVMDGIAAVRGRADAADWARRLREAALQDEYGKALDGALETIRSFA